MAFVPKHILVPVDTDPVAEEDLAQLTVDGAIDLAKRFNARIELVAVIPPVALPSGYETSLDFTGTMTEVLNARREHADHLLQRWASRAADSGVQATTEVIDGLSSVAGAIVGHIKVSGADAVVMTTHGRKGLTRFLLGSVAERVAHLAPVPVLLLRAPPS